eukprot:TRINITY_DN2350_c3_g1_i1.p1 TRINITY_DN2350_c3_g1~~TRINITY_DN2350_c3_g1_i1.p1  ORF type:complete len:171 (+),score=12.18 TRINITY_DN2350_c3_g1_i1:60-572(+)
MGKALALAVAVMVAALAATAYARNPIVTKSGCKCQYCFNYGGQRYLFTDKDNSGVSWCYTLNGCGKQGSGGSWDNVFASGSSACNHFYVTDLGCTCRRCFNYGGEQYTVTNRNNNGISWCYTINNCGKSGQAGSWDNISDFAGEDKCSSNVDASNDAHKHAEELIELSSG